MLHAIIGSKIENFTRTPNIINYENKHFLKKFLRIL